MNLYNFIIFNLDNLSVRNLNNLLLELEFNNLANWLKNKFKDKRSTEELVLLIKQEYNLLG